LRLCGELFGCGFAALGNPWLFSGCSFVALDMRRFGIQITSQGSMMTTEQNWEEDSASKQNGAFSRLRQEEGHFPLTYPSFSFTLREKGKQEIYTRTLEINKIG